MHWTCNPKANPSRTLHQAQLVDGLRGHDCRVMKLKTNSPESGPWARRSWRASCGARRSGCRRRWRRRGAKGGYAERNTTPYPSCTLHQAQLVGELRRAQERLQAEVAAQGLALAGLAAERDACRAAAAAADERLKVQSLGSPRAYNWLFSRSCCKIWGAAQLFTTLVWLSGGDAPPPPLSTKGSRCHWSCRLEFGGLWPRPRNPASLMLHQSDLLQSIGAARDRMAISCSCAAGAAACRRCRYKRHRGLILEAWQMGLQALRHAQ